MKKILSLLFILVCTSYAQTQKLSPIPPAKEFYVNLDYKYCDKTCLVSELERGEYLSFLATYKKENSDDALSNIYAKLSNSVLDFKRYFQKASKIKLALIIPQNTIKIYSNILINSSIAYLLRQNANIKVKVFLIGDESEEGIKKTMQSIQDEHFSFIIAGLTKDGVPYLEKYLDDEKVFVPTVNAAEVGEMSKDISFGGIDYKAQIQKLLLFANAKIKVFSNSSVVSKRLNNDILELRPDAKILNIADSSFDFKRLLKKNGSFNNASIFFNTTLIKTALASSQLRSYELTPKILLSTQINYNPILLHLTQSEDIKNFLFANSIQNEDETLAYLNDIFNQNINYNWVAYSTSIGLDLFYTQFLNKDAKRVFKEELENSQVKYDIKIMHSKGLGFEEYKEEEDEK